nr:hypothetical protein [Alkalibacter mobilis]
MQSGFDDSQERCHGNFSAVWGPFSLSTKSGKQLYNYLSDEDLLDVLRNKADKLGRSPSQKEIFCVWREYIKTRFKKWPLALKAAGLPTSAGKGGLTLEQKKSKDERIVALLEQVRAETLRLGRIPHPQDLPDVCSELNKYMDKWAEVLTAANVQKILFSKKSVEIIKDLEDEYVSLLATLKKQAVSLGRAPLHTEVDAQIKRKLILRCGSWRNALHQIGLQPVMRINPFSSTSLSGVKQPSSLNHSNSLHDCYYKILNLDKQAKQDLIFVLNLYKRLGRTPNKKEIPVDIRKRLQTKCGSWANTLFQIGLIQT